MTSAAGVGHPELPVPLIRVQGSPVECGFGYGAAARELITANVNSYLRRFRDAALAGKLRQAKSPVEAYDFLTRCY